MTIPQKQSFTCASCHALFQSAEDQRTHYQSDWHRYNLRRKVSELPPVTIAVFEQRSSILKTDSLGGAEVTTFDCRPCRKTFSSENAFSNHILSKRHLATLKETVDVDRNSPSSLESSLESKSTSFGKVSSKNKPDLIDLIDVSKASVEEIEEAFRQRLDVTKRLKPEDCLFCPFVSIDADASFEHMQKSHGLYIPDLEFLQDRAGLLAYLADKLAVALCCIACPLGKAPFSSLDAVRKHMVDCGHTKIRFDDDGMNELADFYDYSAFDSDYTDEDTVCSESMEVDSLSEEIDINDDTLYISPDETCLLLPSGKRLSSRTLLAGHRQLSQTNNSYKSGLDMISNLNNVDKMEMDVAERRSRRSKWLSQVKVDERSRTAAMCRSDQGLLSMNATPSQINQYAVDQRLDHERNALSDVRQGIRNNRMQHHFRLQLRQ